MTDKELITKLFRNLRKHGLFARQSYLCCLSCASAQAEVDMKESHTGIVFYHQQDAEAFKIGGKELKRSLMIRYDSRPSNDEGRKKLAETIVSEAEQLGLDTDWNGSTDQCVSILPQNREDTP